MSRIDLDHFRQLAAEKWLAIRSHPELPLHIINYTPNTQYERNWTAETLQSRGLIVDDSGKIIARPFPKFFNLDEYISLFGPVPEEPFEVFEKMDGSLGILYQYEDTVAIASRGSFTSEQARMANHILRRDYAHVDFDPDFTYLFEIIYPENRIVVDYGAKTDLVLLGIIHTSTGEEFPLTHSDFETAKQYPGFGRIDDLREVQEANQEGFVVRFKSGLRVKVKFEEYVRLHRILTNVTARTIWEHLKDDQPLDELIAEVPDEFYEWVKDTAADLRQQFSAIEALGKAEFTVLEDRKATALHFMQHGTYPKLLFLLLDERDYRDYIWKLVYPPAANPFRNQEEEEA